MQERFKLLLEDKNLTATRFAAMINVNASAMSHILNGRSKPGFDVLDKIINTFPELNLNWLVSGKGAMYNNGKIQTQKEEHNIIQDSSLKKKNDVPSPFVPDFKDMDHKKNIKRIILFFDDGTFESYE